jgi:hypothetical protein
VQLVLASQPPDGLSGVELGQQTPGVLRAEQSSRLYILNHDLPANVFQEVILTIGIPV